MKRKNVFFLVIALNNPVLLTTETFPINSNFYLGVIVFGASKVSMRISYRVYIQCDWEEKRTHTETGN